MKTEVKEIGRVAYEAYTREKFPHWEEAQTWDAEGIAEQEGWRAAARAVVEENMKHGGPFARVVAGMAAAAYAIAFAALELGWHTAASVVIVAAPGGIGLLAVAVSLRPLFGVPWRSWRKGER